MPFDLPPLAALPPFAQTSREYQAILADPRLFELLGSAEAIEAIFRQGDSYFVATRHYLLEVKVHYLPGGIGPRPFELEFLAPLPRSL